MGGAVVVGEFPIGIELQGEPVGHFLQLIGPQFGGFLGQEDFGAGDRVGVDVLGQFFEEFLDRAQVFEVEQSGVPGFGGGGQRRRQVLSGEGGSGLQLPGVAQAPAGLGGGDPHNVGDHFGCRPAQGRVAAAVDRTDKVQGGGGRAPADGLQPVEGFQTPPDRK